MNPIDLAIATLKREGYALTAYLPQCQGEEIAAVQAVLNALEEALIILEKAHADRQHDR